MALGESPVAHSHYGGAARRGGFQTRPYQGGDTARIAPPVFEERQGFLIVTFKAAISPEIQSRERKLGKRLGDRLGVELGDTRSQIVALMKKNARIAIPAIAKRLDFTTTAVEKQIAILKKMGIIQRLGPAKGGRWEVVE